MSTLWEDPDRGSQPKGGYAEDRAQQGLRHIWLCSEQLHGCQFPGDRKVERYSETTGTKFPNSFIKILTAGDKPAFFIE